MTSRAVYVPVRGQLHLLAEHIRSVTAAGEFAIVVTVHHPAAMILGQLKKDGIDASSVGIIDAVGHGETPEDVDKKHGFTHFVASPTLLESVGMRLRKLVRAKGHPNPHVIVIDCDALAFHNPGSVVEEFLRYVVQQITKEVPVDVVMAEPSRLDHNLQQFLHGFLPNELHLGRHGAGMDRSAPSPA